jgi:hypothetical protein
MAELVKAFVQREGPVASLLLVTGAIVVLKVVYTFLHGIYARLLRPGKNIKKVYGSWGRFLPISVI